MEVMTSVDRGAFPAGRGPSFAGDPGKDLAALRLLGAALEPIVGAIPEELKDETNPDTCR